MAQLSRLLRDDTGATAIEYGLIAALIAVVAIASIRGVGNEVLANFDTVANEMAS